MKFVLENQDMSYIKKMELEALKYSGVVSMAQWVPWYKVPDSIVEFVTEKISKWETNRYSIVPWISVLREQVALRYLQKYGVDINFQNEIIITAWAIQAITSIMLTILASWDEVILIDPSYASYNWCIRVAKWNPVYVPLNLQLDIDVEKVKSSITDKTKAIIISNPNNPTGSIFWLDKIKEILDFIKWKDTLLVLDEVYDEFIYDGNIFDSGIKLYNEYKSNLVIINSWSKTFWMTGWRVGYMICESKLFDEVLKVHDSMVTCAPVHSQWAALASFDIYDEWTENVRKQLQQRRDYVVDSLNSMTEYIDFNVPWAAYFVFPKFRYTDDDYSECLKILDQKQVCLVPGKGFGKMGEWRFRICFGRDFDDIKKALDRLYDYFRNR